MQGRQPLTLQLEGLDIRRCLTSLQVTPACVHVYTLYIYTCMYCALGELWFSDILMYLYMYMYIHCMYMYLYMYIYHLSQFSRLGIQCLTSILVCVCVCVCAWVDNAVGCGICLTLFAKKITPNFRVYLLAERLTVYIHVHVGTLCPTCLFVRFMGWGVNY